MAERQTPKTYNTVIAHNVERLRKAAEPELSFGKLAERLSHTIGKEIGEHVARDMVRPRKGQPQRSFSWDELVALCAVFDVLLFDLVLPPTGWVSQEAFAMASAAKDQRLLEVEDARYRMSVSLFGVALAEDLAPLVEKSKKEAERRQKILQDAINQIFEGGGQ